MFHRAPHKSGFTIFDNGFLSGDLSLDARGLLATILSLPDDWQFSERGLCRIVPDGRRKVHGALSELERAGYIVRHGQKRDQAGRMTAQEWEIIESPQVATVARNVTADASRENADNSQVMPDARNAQAGANRENIPSSQVATVARYPRAVNVQQSSINYQVPIIKDGTGGAAAGGTALSRLSCPECGASDGVMQSGGMFTCSCGWAWKG